MNFMQKSKNRGDIMEIRDYFKHGESMVENYDAILCTEKGKIVFLNQKENIAYEMHANGIELIQFVTDGSEWNCKITWLTNDYWLSIRDSYNLIYDD